MAIQEFPQQMKTLAKKLSAGKLIALVVVLGGTIAALLFVISWSAKSNLQVLYSNLTPEDAGSILAKLKEQKIPYHISEDGKSIQIPQERVYETRLSLASEGLPQGGAVGFEIFDNTKLGMTEFVQNVNYQRALQGELARTITGFSEVENCRVHIVMPSRSLFVEEEEAATASVVLKLRSGKWLANEQVQGIVHLVSSSVSGLDPENVTVVDNYGKMLAGLKKDSSIGMVNSDQVEFQDRVERNLEQRIKSMLEKALGPDKAVVRLSCSMDFKRFEKTEERYDPDTQVVRSEQMVNEQSSGRDTAPAGVPGVMSNVAGVNGVPEATGLVSNGYQKQDRTINYEISKITSHTVEPVGKIQRVSVAVMVDGSYRTEENEDGETQTVYVPRTEDEMKKFENIVKSAVDYDANRGDKVEVVNIPFEKTPLSDQETSGEGWWQYVQKVTPLLRYGFVGVFCLLAFVFVVRPLVQWLILPGPDDGEIFNRLPRTVEELEREYTHDTRSLPFRDRAIEMISKDGEQSAKMLQEWLKEGA
ncbi:MAG TPA: flagellar basal-body MS-ring/collar protein FliF [Thermodesulfobacteriota bacterium]|nr:flagellar M-ring protein FliF [Deltaproteobacteria bacterium]HNU70137.1 flagellar basal-body MS-ring/collar protein FliF [Thermodesulfobacteriota bacterium]HQO77195.1 flagellar basal-body MS-ring/collar protein FliF [Thermodesulfobacteriota bacterium]